MEPVKQYVKDEHGRVHEIQVVSVPRKRNDGTVRLAQPKAGDPVKAGYKGPVVAEAGSAGSPN